jgi:hypothetical protein
MVTVEMQEYIERARAKGLSEDEIRVELRQAGWSDNDIEEGLSLTHEDEGKELLGAMGLIQNAFDLIRERWKIVTPVLFFPTLLINLFTISIEKYTVEMPNPTSLRELQTLIVRRVEAILDPYYLLVIPLSLAVMVAGVAAVLAFCKTEIRSWQEAYQESYKFVWKYVLLSLAVGVIGLFGFLLFVIPGFVFNIWFVVVLPVLILEKKGVLETLVKSRWLVQGRFWETLGRYLVYMLVVLVLSVSCGAVGVMTGLDLVASTAGSLITQLFGIAFTIVLYEDLVRTKSDNFEVIRNKGRRFMTWLLGVSSVVVVTLGTILMLAMFMLINTFIVAEKRGENVFERLPIEVQEELEREWFSEPKR